MVNSQFEEMIACDEYVDTYQKEVISYKNFNELKILPVLTREEEIELMLQIKNGNEEESVQAKNKFIEHNLRLVIQIAKRNLEPNIDIFDLFQEGIIGLMKAIDNFDITKGYKFSTYAVPWINQCIQRYKIDKSTTIRIPVHTFEKAENIKKHIKYYVMNY